nr:hypothetical protein CFP56_07754 [Quercus suber]
MQKQISCPALERDLWQHCCTHPREELKPREGAQSISAKRLGRVGVSYEREYSMLIGVNQFSNHRRSSRGRPGSVDRGACQAVPIASRVLTWRDLSVFEVRCIPTLHPGSCSLATANTATANVQYVGRQQIAARWNIRVLTVPSGGKQPSQGTGDSLGCIPCKVAAGRASLE